MSQKNMGRLAQDMKREIIAIIGRLKDPRLEGGLLTVTRLDVTPDLDVAKVYVSVMGRADGIFVEDDGAAYAAHINELLRSLNVSGEAEAQPEAGETEE